MGLNRIDEVGSHTVAVRWSQPVGLCVRVRTHTAH